MTSSGMKNSTQMGSERLFSSTLIQHTAESLMLLFTYQKPKMRSLCLLMSGRQENISATVHTNTW